MKNTVLNGTSPCQGKDLIGENTVAQGWMAGPHCKAGQTDLFVVFVAHFTC